MHKRYRRLSWGATPELRATGVADIEARASDYGLPPIVWPEPYPANSLTVMRAAVWADGHGRLREYARSAFSAAFERGVDLTQRIAVLEIAGDVGLDVGDADAALDSPALEAALATLTEEAIAAGVFGVPRLRCWWPAGGKPSARCRRPLSAARRG